ncbi:MAG: AmmeMemoRadiSam system protein B [Nanoarchaeota archaeon]|nr:AmmeMemoRadiSam system protein B [Nanoarchaeota archaeon]
MNRKPIACPEYYPNTFERLDSAIVNAFMHKNGPGTLQSSRRDTEIKLLITPSEKIEKAGSCMSWGYKDIAEAKFPKTYIILGTNHHSTTKFSTYLFADWETPLGPVKTNQEIGKELSNLFPQLINEHTAHENEHSIEIQLPWLQFASRDKLSELSFIPISINIDSIKDIQILAEALFKIQDKATIIASSNIEDTATLQYIQSGDPEALINYKKRKQKDIKEIAPLLTILELARMQNKKPVIINHQASKDRMYYACIKYQ